MSRAGRCGTKEAYIVEYALLGAHSVATPEGVSGKVDVAWSPAMFYLLDSLFDVGVCDWHCRWR